jgi:hypothetical protein
MSSWNFHLMKLALEHLLLLSALHLCCRSLLLLVESMLILRACLPFLLLLLLLLDLRLLLFVFDEITQLRSCCIFNLGCCLILLLLLEIVLLLLRWDYLLRCGHLGEQFVQRGFSWVWMLMLGRYHMVDLVRLLGLINHRHSFIIVLHLQNIILIKVIELGWLDRLGLQSGLMVEEIFVNSVLCTFDGLGCTWLLQLRLRMVTIVILCSRNN